MKGRDRCRMFYKTCSRTCPGRQCAEYKFNPSVWDSIVAVGLGVLTWQESLSVALCALVQRSLQTTFVCKSCAEFYLPFVGNVGVVRCFGRVCCPCVRWARIVEYCRARDVILGVGKLVIVLRQVRSCKQDLSLPRLGQTRWSVVYSGGGLFCPHPLRQHDANSLRGYSGR